MFKQGLKQGLMQGLIEKVYIFFPEAERVSEREQILSLLTGKIGASDGQIIQTKQG